MITKEKMEAMCRKAGMIPEKRINIDGYDVYIADGFSFIPHIAYFKFGVEPGEFPYGAFCTIWFIAKDENLSVGLPLIFDANHDLNIEDRKHARINRAIVDAKAKIKTIRDHRRSISA